MENWNDTIFALICKVNRNLQSRNLTERAMEQLSRLEDCLCSGDGLTEESAFRAKGPDTVKRVLSLLGISASGAGRETCGNRCRIPLEENPFGLRALYFSVQA